MTTNWKADAGLAPRRADASPPLSAGVLAEFEVRNIPCRIVRDDGLQAACERNGLGRVLGRFEVEGRRFAICIPAPRGSRSDDPPPDPLAVLTPREFQIVQLVCGGCVNKQIAHRLRISEYTVKTYLKQIFGKLKVHSRSAMVYRCTVCAGILEERRLRTED